MERTLHYTVTAKDQKLNILAFLRERGFSRNILISMKSDSRAILLNGVPAFARTRLKEGDLLCIRIPEDSASEKIAPVEMPLHVLHEDEDILVLNKPADTPVHPSRGNHGNTLANGAAWYFSAQDQPFVFRCINRLDRDTSGVLVLAKNALSAAILSQDIARRRIRRTYLAVVSGITPKSGIISAPIARKAGSVLEREVNYEKGEPAVTYYEQLAVYDHFSLLELHLETGRTHQIRVHLKHIGHPLPGDYLYNPDYTVIRRQPLHSYQLEFRHPVHKNPLLFTAPVPKDFLAFTENR